MSELEDLIARLRDAADEALADHEDDVARIADMDGPIAAKVCADDPVEVVLALTTVQRCIEALGHAAEPGWQPISSAPRDGTVVDLWGPFGRWTGARWKSDPGRWVAFSHGRGRVPVYHSRSEGEFTHWMPPPTPPVEAATPAHAELSPGNSSDLRGEEG